MTKKLIFPCIAICFLTFTSCKSKSNDSVNSVTNDDKTSLLDKVDNLSKMAEISEKSTVRIEELKKMTPISNEDLKSFFKEEAAGMKRNNFSVQNAMGYSVGEANYKKNDSVEYKIMINDCSGEMGSGLYSLMMMTKLNIETENENGYEKTIDFMGKKALKSYQNTDQKCSLSYVEGERFWIQVEGYHTTFEDLEAFIKTFELNKLESFK
jgi:hypothetical protein